jgi:hypothetical protein
MFPYLQFLDTPSGRLTIGATARSSQSNAQGVVTGIQETHYDALSSHSVQIAGRLPTGSGNPPPKWYSLPRCRPTCSTC